MLLIKSSKLSVPRSFSMSIIWKILTGLLPSLSLTFTALFPNQVEWIFPSLFSWRHLYASWWFPWHMLSNMKSLPEIFSLCRSSDLFRRFFPVNKYFLFKFPAFKFHNNRFFLLQTMASLQVVWFNLMSCLANVQFELLITNWWRDRDTSMDSCRWYWTSVTAFLSNWTTLLVSNLLQFLVMAKSDETTSNLLKKSSNRFVKSEIFDVMSSTVMSSSISSSFERFSNWLLVRTILVEDDNRM